MQTYAEYEKEIADYAKENYDVQDIDFDNETIKDICETGYRLSSFPYYPADRIMDYLYPD